ncbi:hypothetical protein OFL98_25175, partial [Escherichia coli]|nr:hypothetical protein [Escherichia coli]
RGFCLFVFSQYSMAFGVSLRYQTVLRRWDIDNLAKDSPSNKHPVNGTDGILSPYPAKLG